jgi:hypothetical protein
MAENFHYSLGTVGNVWNMSTPQIDSHKEPGAVRHEAIRK